jgi:hypothetical protein
LFGLFGVLCPALAEEIHFSPEERLDLIDVALIANRQDLN